MLVLYFVKDYQSLINTTPKKILTDNEDSLNKNNRNESLDTTYQIDAIQEATDEIEDFNLELIDLLGFDLNSKSNEISEFTSLKRNNSQDVVEKINWYLSNIEENQIQVNDLIIQCSNIEQKLKLYEKGILDKDKQISEMSFNEYYFYNGLKESGICNILGTPKDPFYELLNLARNGNKLSQLLLIDNLYIATNRGLINVLKYPEYYKELRDEAVMYLKHLSHIGVTRASEKLGRLYSNKSNMIPTDYVLQYYYSFLAQKQEGPERIYVNLDSIYEGMSDKQKAIADRMTENL